ncbi:MAG: PAS domain-containing protein [Coriobacteriia bacterium]
MTEFRAEDLLESLKEPLVYCDPDHVIRYMNAAARERYANRPAAVGRSIFDCHNSTSNSQIVEVGERLAAGEDDVQLSAEDGQRSFMRAVRSADGEYLGYYERYEMIGADG